MCTFVLDQRVSVSYFPFLLFIGRVSARASKLDTNLDEVHHPRVPVRDEVAEAVGEGHGEGARGPARVLTPLRRRVSTALPLSRAMAREMISLKKKE
jgi:hypothetical protein